MGSRKKPNHGGSGLHETRRSRPKYDSHKQANYIPFKTIGEVDVYLNSGLIACLICGREYKMLGGHLSSQHAISSDQYKDEFNIPRSYSLNCQDLRERKSNIMLSQWQDNDKLKSIKPMLKKRMKSLGSNNDGGKRRSTLKKALSDEKRRNIAENNAKINYDRFRPIYLSKIVEAIDKGVTLYTIHRHTSQIYSFADRHSEDIEFNDALSKVKKPNHVKDGEGVTTAACKHCGDNFMTRTSRPQSFCSRKCHSESMVKKVDCRCSECGADMLLTPSSAAKVKTCSKACSSKRRSRSQLDKYDN